MRHPDELWLRDWKEDHMSDVPTPDRLKRNFGSDPKGDKLRNKIRAASHSGEIDGYLYFVKGIEERFRDIPTGKDDTGKWLYVRQSTGWHTTFTDGTFDFTIRSNKPLVRFHTIGQRVRLTIEPEAEA